MMELLRLYSQIALLRRGPQDVPASNLLLTATIVAYVLINLIVATVLPQVPGPWLQIIIVDVLFTIGWYAVLLRMTGKPERFLQTTTAIFGYQAVLAPLSIAAGHLVRRFSEDPMWQLPVGMLYLLLLVWMIAINTHVLRAAIEWSLPSCVALVILQLLAAQLLLAAVFPEIR